MNLLGMLLKLPPVVLSTESKVKNATMIPTFAMYIQHFCFMVVLVFKIKINCKSAFKVGHYDAAAATSRNHLTKI